MVLHPQKVEAFGYDTRYGITQLTRDLIGTEKHEMLVFFQKFERALHIGKLDGSNPTVWEAWEALGRVLWGLPSDLYKYMRMDYDNVDMLMDMKEPLYDTFRDLLLNGAAVYREEIRTEGRGVQNVPGLSGYTAVLKYTHLGYERPSDRPFQTVSGPRTRRPPMGNESQLVEMLPSSGAGHRVFASSLETVDGRLPSRRIVLENEVEPTL